MQFRVEAAQIVELPRHVGCKPGTIASAIDEQRIQILFAAGDAPPEIGNVVRNPWMARAKHHGTHVFGQSGHPRQRGVQQNVIRLLPAFALPRLLGRISGFTFGFLAGVGGSR